MKSWFAEKFSKILDIEKDEVEKELEIPPEVFGDLSLKIAFKIAKKEKKNPIIVAKKIKEKLETLDYFSKVEVINGYINFFINFSKLLPELLDYAINFSPKKLGNRLIVEHTSVNPNKAIHIGHLRNSCLGDSIIRLLKFFGENPIAINYVDDTGAQVADNIVGIYFLGIPKEKKGMKFDKYQGDEVYVKVNEEYKRNPKLLEKRKEILKAIEEGNNEIAKLAREITTKILISQLETLQNFNIFFDLIVRESDILKSSLWNSSFEKLKSAGIITFKTSGKNKGCWVFEDSEIGEKVLVRSNGTVVYAGKDVAYTMWKHGLIEDKFRYRKLMTQKNGKTLWITAESGEERHHLFSNVDTSINVIDIRQTFEQKAIKKMVEELGKKMNRKINYIHYSYEVVALTPKTVKKLGKEIPEDSKIVHMSGRKGIYINADDFLKELSEILKDEIKKRNPEEKNPEEKAKRMAVDILKFELLKYNPLKMIVLDMDEMLKVKEGNGVYVLYSYARASSILRKAEGSSKGLENFAVPEKLEKEEKELAKKVIQFPDIVKEARDKLAPNIIAEYLTKLSLIFNRFYEKYPVLKEKNKNKKLFRLKLVYCFKEVLSKGLSLLGIEPLERI